MVDPLFFAGVAATVKFVTWEVHTRIAPCTANVSVKMSSIWQTCPCVMGSKSWTRQAVEAARRVPQKGVIYAIRARF